MKIPMLPQLVLDRRWFTIEDDFVEYLTSGKWSSILEANATAAESDAVGGILVLTTLDTANTAAGVATSAEIFKFADDKPLACEGRIQYTEVNTNKASVVFGFADAFAADVPLTDLGADAINSSGAIIYKTTGGTVWNCASENNSVVNDTASQTTAGGSAYQTLRIDIICPDALNVEITYFVDGVQLKDTNGLPIKHSLAIASSTEMDFGVLVKAGDAGSQVLKCDYLAAAQIR